MRRLLAALIVAGLLMGALFWAREQLKARRTAQLVAVVIRSSRFSAQTEARFWLERGADANALAPNRAPLVRVVAARQDLEMVRLLLRFGARRDAKTDQLLRVLHSKLLVQQARRGNFYAMQLHLRSGANIDFFHAGHTPLTMTLSRGNLREAAQLLRAGANPNFRDKQGNTPVELAIGRTRPWSTPPEPLTAILDVLAQKGARFSRADAVHAAVWRGQWQSVERHLRAGMPIDERAANSWTALMTAAYCGHEAIVGELIERGANPGLKDKRGQSALQIAIAHAQSSMVSPSQNWTRIAEVLKAKRAP